MSREPNAVSAHGKVILAGEHAVVRGGEALVFPLRSRSLRLSWNSSVEKGFSISPGPLEKPFLEALELAMRVSEHKLPHQGCRFSLESDIPIQAGLGSSAALSVAVARFLLEEGALLKNPFQLALEVENMFHGKSSGIDVACILGSSPISYSKSSGAENLLLSWKPSLFLIDTGLRSATKDCVKKVELAKRSDLDERMKESVKRAKTALHSTGPSRFTELGDALELAASCFEEWGLGPEPELRAKLQDAGAVAVKPTGSGGGGFLLGLWPEPPSPSARKKFGLIPIWEDFS